MMRHLMPGAIVTDRERLRQVPYFRLLSAADLAGLGRHSRARLFEKSEMIFREGEPCGGLWVVAEGRVGTADA